GGDNQNQVAFALFEGVDGRILRRVGLHMEDTLLAGEAVLERLDELLAEGAAVVVDEIEVIARAGGAENDAEHDNEENRKGQGPEDRHAVAHKLFDARDVKAKHRGHDLSAFQNV